MSHQHHGRVCHLNGCDDETVPVVCPACEQPLGRAPKGGMAQASATWDKRKTYLPDCPTRRGGVTMPIASWYCTHPGERTFAPADGPVLPEPDRCAHEECKPPGPQLLLDATPADEQDIAELRREKQPSTRRMRPARRQADRNAGRIQCLPPPAVSGQNSA